MHLLCFPSVLGGRLFYTILMSYLWALILCTPASPVLSLTALLCGSSVARLCLREHLSLAYMHSPAADTGKVLSLLWALGSPTPRSVVH